MVCVSWHDALAYISWLAETTGHPWRLPTEAEWEKAARGTDGRLFPWGDRWDKTRANTTDGGPNDTTPVGHYPGGASPYGVYDLAGNVREWCGSRYKSYPYRRHDGREDLDPARDHYDRMARGGLLNAGPQFARAASRSAYTPSTVYGSHGFRVVRAAPVS